MKWLELEGAGAGWKEHPNNKQQPGVCSLHPNNKQQPGVCSSCLRDKLSKLYNNKPTPTDPLPYYPASFSSASPKSSSNYVSPTYLRRHRRHASLVKDSVSSMISFDYGLEKSKSIAFAPRNLLRDREVNGDHRGSKKDKFWSRLLKFTRKDTKEAFMHSRTMREGKG